MNVLIACEYSGAVREAFKARGHYAVSCDLLPSDVPCAEHEHYTGDVRDILFEGWDLLIAFPPCTDICVSSAGHFAAKRADGRQQRGVDFFRLLADAPCPRIAVENPVGIMSTVWRKPDQIIQPWQFGDPESKKTCLWLKGLPLLTPTNVLPLPPSGRWSNQTASGQNKLAPSPLRWKLRSKTYPGIAAAMAAQWGGQ